MHNVLFILFKKFTVVRSETDQRPAESIAFSENKKKERKKYITTGVPREVLISRHDQPSQFEAEAGLSLQTQSVGLYVYFLYEDASNHNAKTQPC